MKKKDKKPYHNYQADMYDPPSKEQLINEIFGNSALDMFHVEFFQNLISNECSFTFLNYNQMQLPDQYPCVRPPNIPSF